jgi:hypothetical protein
LSDSRSITSIPLLWFLNISENLSAKSDPRTGLDFGDSRRKSKTRTYGGALRGFELFNFSLTREARASSCASATFVGTRTEVWARVELEKTPQMTRIKTEMQDILKAADEAVTRSQGIINS